MAVICPVIFVELKSEQKNWKHKIFCADSVSLKFFFCSFPLLLPPRKPKSFVRVCRNNTAFSSMDAVCYSFGLVLFIYLFIHFCFFFGVDNMEEEKLNYIPEIILKKRKSNEEWALRKKEQFEQKKFQNKKSKDYIKKPEDFILEYRSRVILFLSPFSMDYFLCIILVPVVSI